MIVKNEEHNIERALAWARGIAFEQIVVDTGSTDKTVEIAESLGAKVFHFKWIDDFAAAKNFALDKARGTWIAFLDADEYFTAENAAKIIPLIDENKRRADIICCELVNLDDAGNPFSVVKQNRIFRNLPALRYTGSIHEALVYTPEQLHITNAISIQHTGYTKRTLDLTQKSERNITMLSAELEKHPNDANRKGYLAASFLASSRVTPSNAEKAVELYREVVNSGQRLNEVVAHSSHSHLIKLAFNTKDYEEAIKLCVSAKKALADSPDFAYWHGLALYNLERDDEAWDQFTECCELISNATLINTNMGESFLFELFRYMSQTAIRRGDNENGLKYLTFSLDQKKYEESLCSKFISVLRAVCKENDREIIDYLCQFYDFDDPRDKLFLAKCAKEANDTVLMFFFYKSITDADREALYRQETA
jgi:glycosyltransferase involved in cell wall biosynthesis